jgi:hypothetical protein
LYSLCSLICGFNGVAPSLLKISVWTGDSSEIVAIGYVEDNAVGSAYAQSFLSFCYNSPQGAVTEIYVGEVFRGMVIAHSKDTCVKKELQSVVVGV